MHTEIQSVAKLKLDLKFETELVVLLAKTGKVSTLVYDPAVNNMKVVSLHYFEKEAE